MLFPFAILIFVNRATALKFQSSYKFLWLVIWCGSFCFIQIFILRLFYQQKRLGSNPRPMDLYFRKWMMTYLKIDIFFAIIFFKNLYTAIHFIRTTTEIYLRTEVSKLWNHCWYFHMYFFLNRLTNYRNFLKSYQKSSLVDHEIFFTRY